MTDYSDLDSPRDARGKRSARTLWAVALTFIATMLIFLDPLGWHGVDERLRHATHPASEASGDHLWTCPMHPEVVTEEEGPCPICGMDLVPVTTNGPQSTADTMYSCGMHPQILEAEAGTCPICGMDLTPVSTADPSATGDDSTIVTLEPAVLQRMNVRTALAERRRIAVPWRTVGVLELDQTSAVTVTPRFAGWVERVRVHDLGETVRQGQILAEIYAPELVQTQEELLSAVRYAARLDTAPEATRARANDLVAAARSRLAYWQVTPAAIDRLIDTGAVQRTVPIHAPRSGVVTERPEALEGRAVRAGDVLFRLASLDVLWLTVEVDEDRIGQLRLGSPTEITFDAFPGEAFTGKLRRLQPALDPTTRTLGARVEVINRDRRLRPGLFATVEITPPEDPGEAPIVVPGRAVLRTGSRDVVILDLGDGRFTPRQVQIGTGDGELLEVIDGLDAGDRIVTSAQFLIDSEANLQAAIEQMRGASTDTGHHH